MKMKIGIDARLLMQTGVGTYLRNLIFNLGKLKNDHSYHIIVRGEDKNWLDMHAPELESVVCNAHWHSLAEQTQMLSLLNSLKLDLMHFTYFSFPLLYSRPFVTTIHDITPLTHATGRASTKPLTYPIKHAAYKILLNKAISSSKLIITPTRAVALDIQQQFPKQKDLGSKLMPIYEGIDIDIINAVNLSQAHHVALNLPDKYILYLGNCYPHKNIPRLLRAFNNVKTDYHLVIAGGKDMFMSQAQQLATSLPSASRIHFFHDFSSENRHVLYQQAKGLIHPSLAEGFGLTTLEALYCGTNIAASRIAPLREILTDLPTIWCDPTDEKDITHAIQKLIHQPQMSLAQVQTIRRQIDEKFSFQDMSLATANLYNKALDGGI